MRIKSGIKLLAEVEGQGEPAEKGDGVVFNWRLYRNQGEEISVNEQQAENLPREMIRHMDGRRWLITKQPWESARRWLAWNIRSMA
jgi:hypothetical protein